MARTHRFWLIAAAFALSPGCTCRASFEGLFFHTFTGAATGSEWSTWGPIAGDGRYEFSDLGNDGSYPGTISQAGGVVFDGGVGTGAFSGHDAAQLHFTLGGGVSFDSQLRRAPYTDDRFPVFFTGAVLHDSALSGAWSARVREVDPATGVTIAERTEAVEVVSGGSTIRVGGPGWFVRGVWLGDAQAGLRLIAPTPGDPRYRSFPGCAFSGGPTHNMVGDLRVVSDHEMTLALFFQTRAPFPAQAQSMQYIELTRVPSPGPLGACGACVFVVGVHRRRRAGNP